jgi:hypothetical protein
VKHFIFFFLTLTARGPLENTDPISASTVLKDFSILAFDKVEKKRKNTTEKGELERKAGLELLQAKSSCGVSFNLPIRQCEAPPFKAGGQALLRVNLEQAPAFRPGSRKVHILYFPKSSGFMSEIMDFSSSSSSKRLDAKTPICFVDEITDSAT